MAHGILAQALIERDQLDEARDVVEDAVESAMSPPDVPAPNSFLFLARGLLLLAERRPAEALQDILAVKAALAGYGDLSPGIIAWRPAATRAAVACGDTDHAGVIDDEIALAERFGLPVQLGAALVVKAQVTSGPESDVLLKRAIDLLEENDAPLELARALVERGGRERRAGQRRLAQEFLRRAVHLAHQCGATALQHRAEDELRACGARPRRLAISGLDSLTPSEDRISRLVVQGHSNREIAEMLYLTRNTVAWHVKNVYRKLDVGSRAELARLFDEVAVSMRP